MIKFCGIYFFALITINLSAQFVEIRNGFFYLGEQKFLPMVMNYTVSIRHENDSIYWASPAMSYYTRPEVINCKDEKVCFDQMVSDFQLIKSYGFNTLRIVDFEFGIKNGNEFTDRPYTLDISYYYGPLKFHEFVAPFEDHFKILDKIILAANTVNLKIILVTGGKEVHNFPYDEDYNIYLQYLAHRYQNESCILAYDLLNEPSYFHKVKTKADAYYLVHKWCSSIRQNSKKQLITIGLTGANTIYDWDPIMFDLDFASYHLYPDKNGGLEDYYNNLYWLSKNKSKPWIIGETGFAASSIPSGKKNDGNLVEQSKFLTKTFRNCLDCGGAGYSWWQFHDVAWSVDYGMLDSFNQVKPFAKLFKDLANYVPNLENCKQPIEFYDPKLEKKKSYSGKILNQNNEPIPNAIIRASTNSGSSSISYSKEDGSYTIYNKNKITAVHIAASGYEPITKIIILSFPTIKLKPIEVNEEILTKRIVKNNLEYCLVCSKRTYDICITECGQNKNCTKACKKLYSQNKKDCKKYKFTSKLI
ncbi:MAG: hypothetical protein ABI851_03340 [Saprospiraceae bacterium]